MAFYTTVVASAIGSYAVSFLMEMHLVHRIALFGEHIGLQLSYNPGIAFGMRLPDAVQTLAILIALIIVTVTAIKTAKSSLSQCGYGLIIGGGIANIVDRLPDGLVTDYIQVGSFPVFNVPDACITVGVGVLLLEMVLERCKGCR